MWVYIVVFEIGELVVQCRDNQIHSCQECTYNDLSFWPQVCKKQKKTKNYQQKIINVGCFMATRKYIIPCPYMNIYICMYIYNEEYLVKNK